jgi:hypothetical protein
MSHVAGKLMVLVSLLATLACVCLRAQDANQGLPPIARVWNDQEKSQFRDCVSRISDPSKENATQLNSDFFACAFFQERQHWLNLHPEAAKRKEDSLKLRRCFNEHPLSNIDPPEKYDAMLNLCMCKAYGLSAPKN